MDGKESSMRLVVTLERDETGIWAVNGPCNLLEGVHLPPRPACTLFRSLLAISARMPSVRLAG
jgi:hypothetical protein